MSPALIVAVVFAVLADLISLNLLTSIARALPVERRVRRASKRTEVAALPVRLRQLEALVTDIATGDPLAQGRAGALIRELLPAAGRGSGPLRVEGPLSFAGLDAELRRIEAAGDGVQPGWLAADPAS